MSCNKYGSKFLKGLTSFRVAGEVNSQVIEDYLSALDCPRALTALLLFRNGEHEQLAKLEFDPSHYLTVWETRDAYAATKFLSKFKGLTLNYDLDEVAMQKFMEYESLCKQTNSRFRNLAHDPSFTGRVVWLHTAVIRKIAKILDEFQSEEFFSMPDWGPGASTLIKRRDASPARKFQFETGITRDLYSLIPLGLMEEKYPLWASQLSLSGFPTLQAGNKVITVPKDATTNRVIAIEPGINLWFQKSVGEMIGRRLRRYGVDLRFQSRNQELARLGSLTNQLATVDLSSASDSISRALVEEIIPPRWFAIMDACRSHFGTVDSRVIKWEKFSSMGNGFTFQLESLIFYAMATSCAEYLHISSADVSVYGDDVILPSACQQVFSELMGFYGFRINAKKSHFSSPFRESCGAHFYSGVDVKPIYLKDRLSSVQSVYRLANAVRRLAHRRNSNFGCDASFRSTFEHLVQKVPSALRLRIPADLGDGGFIANLDEAAPSRARHGIEGYRVRNVVEVNKTYYDETMGYLLASLWSLPSLRWDPEKDITRQEVGRRLLLLRLTGEREADFKLQAMATLPSPIRKTGYNSTPLNGRVSVKVVKSLIQQWYDLGLWL